MTDDEMHIEHARHEVEVLCKYTFPGLLGHREHAEVVDEFFIAVAGATSRLLRHLSGDPSFVHPAAEEAEHARGYLIPRLLPFLPPTN